MSSIGDSDVHHLIIEESNNSCKILWNIISYPTSYNSRHGLSIEFESNYYCKGVNMKRDNLLGRITLPFIAFLMIVSVFLTSELLASGWPQFRGPQGDGISQETNLPDSWDSEKNIQWKIPAPGSGWAAPIIWEDKIYVAGVVEDQPSPLSEEDEEEEEDEEDEDDETPPDTVFRWELHCLDLATGKNIWTKVCHKGKSRISKHRDNTFASETPVTDGKHIYVYFGMRGVYCYDMKGNKVWEKDLGSFEMMNGWGTSSSPVLHGDHLFVQVDNEEKSFLVALNKKDGKEAWRVDRDERSNWGSLFLWKNKKQTEVIASGKKIISYEPTSGKILWELDMKGGRASATPVGDEDHLFVSNEKRRRRGGGNRGGGGGGGLFAVKAGASGNITLKEGETKSDAISWVQPDAAFKAASPIVYQGQIYILDRRGGFLTSFDAKTGKPVIEKKRLGSAFWSSPWAYNGKVFCLDEAGDTHVIKPDKEFNKVATNSIEDRFWATSAMSQGALVLRGVDYLYCIKQ